MGEFGLLFDPRFGRHDPGAAHPERPARMLAVEEGLREAGVLNDAGIVRIEPALITPDEMAWVHTQAYVERLEQACRSGAPYIDTPDSGICGESFQIARFAAGGVLSAARLIARGDLTRAFCAVRPPGHHAERAFSMGFCLLGNVALAAEALKREFGLSRIAIIDFDVHHGNGTQHIFEGDAAVLFVSLHGHPQYLYPGTGFADETGTGEGAGLTLNVPLMPGTADVDYRVAFERDVLPRVQQFAPQFVLISAGFDAHAVDPIGNLSLGDETFAWLTDQIVAIADRSAGGRVLSVLEGGYDLGVLRRCVARHVARLRP